MTVPVKNNSSDANAVIGITFWIEVVLTLLILFSVPSLSSRIGEIYGETNPLIFKMPWLCVFYLPSLFFVIDVLITKNRKGIFLHFYNLRHSVYIVTMVAVFVVFARYMMVTITTN